MIRWTLFYLLMLVTIGVGFRHWFLSLCVLIVFTAFHDHHEFKNTMFDISGLKPWNILFVIVFLQWLTQRKKEGLIWDAPRSWNIAVFLYIGVITYGVAVAMMDFGPLERTGFTMFGFF